MKQIRRIFCTAFSVLLCLVLCSPAFADGADGAISTEEFLSDFQEAFHQRELISGQYDDDMEADTAEAIQTFADCAEAERGFYEKYSKAQLEDAGVQFICGTYLYGLKAQYEAIDALLKNPENDTLWALWNAGTGIRYRAIIELAENYGLPVDDKTLEELREALKWPFLYEEEDSEAAAQSSGFSYVHDPRKNPEAMKDIVENADAVYGFSPDPESKRLGSYAQYDWTDPDFVAKAKEERIAYHDSLESMTDILYKMRDEGATMEEMARAVSAERNRLRLAAYADDPAGLADVKKSNLETYGHEDGPTPDEMYEKYGSWETVLQKSFSANLGMDACCGLFDEYYPLYIELGYADA